MEANQPQWPREWLMTDERIGERLWQAIDRLPGGAGIVFRHHATPEEERVNLAQRLADTALERGLTLAISRDNKLATSLGVPLVHNPGGDSAGLCFSRSAHSFDEAREACEAGASLIFLSPIYRTRSHPGREPMAENEVRRIVAACGVPFIALGGMNRERFARIEGHGFFGWAGIDAWLGA